MVLCVTCAAGLILSVQASQSSGFTGTAPGRTVMAGPGSPESPRPTAPRLMLRPRHRPLSPARGVSPDIAIPRQSPETVFGGIRRSLRR